MSSISRFHIQIIQLFAFVFVWVHWDACLQYGACASQPSSRYTRPLTYTSRSTCQQADCRRKVLPAAVRTPFHCQIPEDLQRRSELACACAAAAVGCMQAG